MWAHASFTFPHSNTDNLLEEQTNKKHVAEMCLSYGIERTHSSLRCQKGVETDILNIESINKKYLMRGWDADQQNMTPQLSFWLIHVQLLPVQFNPLLTDTVHNWPTESGWGVSVLGLTGCGRSVLHTLSGLRETITYSGLSSGKAFVGSLYLVWTVKW